MDNKSLLISSEYHITDKLTIRIPTIEEIIEFGDSKYYGALFRMYSTPFESMGQLDALGIDFEKISQFQLFWYNFLMLSEDEANMLFVGINPKKFAIIRNPNFPDREMLYCEESDISIDENVQEDISDTFRKIHFIEKNNKRVGNSAAKKFLLEKARKKLRKAKDEPIRPFLEQYVVKLFVAPEISASIEDLMHLNIYCFNACLHEIQLRINYDQIMQGVYAGTIDKTKINFEKINWLSIK